MRGFKPKKDLVEEIGNEKAQKIRLWLFIIIELLKVMLETLEVYSRDLEKQIEAKRSQYEAERKRADSINFKLLPPTVALNLKYNPLRL